MSLRAEEGHPIPETTRRVARARARAAFPKGTLCMRLADRLGPLYRDGRFAPLFPGRGQPALSPARLALVTVLQLTEGLSDRQARRPTGLVVTIVPKVTGPSRTWGSGSER